VTLSNGDNFYIHTKTFRSAKKISRFQGLIESVAFDRQGGIETSTRPFLITSVGCLYEVNLDSSGKERVNQLVHQLDKPLPITSLHFEYIGGSPEERYSAASIGSPDTKIFILFATSSPTRLYPYFGGPTFSQLFSDQQQRGPVSYTDLPDIKRADLKTKKKCTWFYILIIC
jgi:hypothetical protein